MAGIKTIVAGHLEMLIRDMLDQELNKVDSGNGLPNKGVVLMAVIVEGNIFAVIVIDTA